MMTTEVQTVPEVVHSETRTNLVGLSRDELATQIMALNLPPFRAKQIWHWIYHRGAKSFDDMTTLARPVRAELAGRFVIGRPAVAGRQISNDGTSKWLLVFDDNSRAETVYIPEEDLGALCISSQVG